MHLFSMHRFGVFPMTHIAEFGTFELAAPPVPTTDAEAEAQLPRCEQATVMYRQCRAEGLSPAAALEEVRQVWRAIWR
jgi:hypothetical protein